MPSEHVLRLGVFHVFNLQGFSGIPLNLVTALNRIEAVDVVNLPHLKPYDPSFMKRIRKRIRQASIGARREAVGVRQNRRLTHAAEIDDRRRHG